MDPPEHYRFRLLLQGAFSKKEMQRWEREFVRDIVRSYLLPLVPRGRGDLATDFAFHYPITVTAVAAGLAGLRCACLLPPGRAAHERVGARSNPPRRRS